MFKIIILPPAKQDIQKAAQWYNFQQKGLGKIFTTQVRKKVEFIKNYPKATAIRYDDVRMAIVDVFPFMLHYTIYENKKIVVIFAVFHTSQNPERWKERD